MNAIGPQLRADGLTVLFECLAVEDSRVHHALNLGVNLEVCQVRGRSRLPGWYFPPNFIKPGVSILVFLFINQINKMLSHLILWLLWDILHDGDGVLCHGRVLDYLRTWEISPGGYLQCRCSWKDHHWYPRCPSKSVEVWIFSSIDHFHF